MRECLIGFAETSWCRLLPENWINQDNSAFSRDKAYIGDLQLGVLLARRGELTTQHLKKKKLAFA